MGIFRVAKSIRKAVKVAPSKKNINKYLKASDTVMKNKKKAKKIGALTGVLTGIALTGAYKLKPGKASKGVKGVVERAKKMAKNK